LFIVNVLWLKQFTDFQSNEQLYYLVIKMHNGLLLFILSSNIIFGQITTLKFNYASNNNLKSYEKFGTTINIQKGIFEFIQDTPKKTILTGKIVNFTPSKEYPLKFNVAVNGRLALVYIYKSYITIDAGPYSIIAFKNLEDDELRNAFITK